MELTFDTSNTLSLSREKKSNRLIVNCSWFVRMGWYCEEIVGEDLDLGFVMNLDRVEAGIGKIGKVGNG